MSQPVPKLPRSQLECPDHKTCHLKTELLSLQVTERLLSCPELKDNIP